MRAAVADRNPVIWSQRLARRSVPPDGIGETCSRRQAPPDADSTRPGQSQFAGCGSSIRGDAPAGTLSHVTFNTVATVPSFRAS